MHKPSFFLTLAIFLITVTACSDDEPQGPEIPLKLKTGPIYELTPDPLAESDIQSCSVYQNTQCVDGKEYSCAIYDTTLADFTASPDPQLEKTFLFDRWYDLYQSPDGQSANRRFLSSFVADEVEEVWGDDGSFQKYDGLGDAAIWTGVALNTTMMRYLSTGTEADYDRFEEKVRDMLRLFDVTGIPGYLARFHFVEMPTGAPPTAGHVTEHEQDDWDHRYHLMENAADKDLPPIYTEGFTDAEGTLWQGTPMWKGNPSIDQYSGSTSSLAGAFGLLKDASLKERITTQLTCYLKRLQRLEIRNLQQNEEAREAITNFFGSGVIDADPDSYDFETIDTVVAYYLPQTNSKNVDSFDKSCPDSIAMEPTKIIDADSDDDFLLEMLILASDMQSSSKENVNSMDHTYVVNIRGADAVHMMNLSALAYYMTDDKQYLDFLEKELIENLRTHEVAQTMGMFTMPVWCRSFYGDHISLTPLWGFIQLLAPDSELSNTMRQTFHSQGWVKEVSTLRNAKFAMLYGSTAPDDETESRDAAIAEGLETMEVMGGNGGYLVQPRRNYGMSQQAVISALPDDIQAICPTEEERHLCEDGFDVFGLTLPGESITHGCTDNPNDCIMEDGRCADPIASYGLPPALRQWSDFIWQRDPFALGREWYPGGTEQSPGLDVSEPYWLGRYFGFIPEAHQILAWEEVGSCE